MKIIQDIKTALSHPDIDLSGIDLEQISSKLRFYENYAASKAQYLGNMVGMPRAFIRIVPVNIPRQTLYGSFAPVDACASISVAPAVKVGHEWVPDEDNIVATVIMSNRAMTEAFLNTHQHNGFPCEVRNLGGDPVKKPTPYFSRSDMYGAHLRDEIKKVQALIPELLSKAKVLLDPEVKLNKKNKQELASIAVQISRYVSSDDRFVLSCDSEHLQRDMLHIRSEILSTITHQLTGMAENYGIEFTGEYTSSGDNPFAYMFEKITNTVDANMSALFERYAQTCSQLEDRRAFVKKAKSYEEKNTYRKGMELGKCILNVSRPSGGHNFFFGEPTYETQYHALSFSFSAEENFAFDGDITYSEISQFLKVKMSNAQVMELLHQQLTGSWVKCTVTNMLGEQISVDELSISDEDFDFKIPTPARSGESDALSKNVEELIELLKGSSQSIKVREGIMALAEEIAKQLPGEGQARYDKYESAFKQMGGEIEAINQRRIEELMERLELKAPDVKKRMLLLLNNKGA